MIGIDLTEVERIKNSLQNEVFLTKILTQKEIEYISQFKNKEEHIAGFFSAKEAVMKALESCKEIGFKNIEICHMPSGKPYVILNGKAKQVFESFNYTQIEISISQTQNFATAICFLK